MAELVPSKQPLITGSIGFGLGILFVFSPPCFPANNRLGRLVRLSECLLALGSFAVAGYNLRLVKLRYAEIWQAEQEGTKQAQLLDLNDRIIEACAVAALPVETKQSEQQSEQPTGNYQPSQQQLERLFYEGSDEIRNWLRQNGFFQPEKSLEKPPDKDCSDLPSNSVNENPSSEQLAENELTVDDGSIKNGRFWNYQVIAFKVAKLLLKGKPLEQSVTEVTGLSSNNGGQFKRMVEKVKSMLEG